MFVTAEVSQDPIGWLNLMAQENMDCMFVVVLKVHPTWRAKKALD